MASPDPTLPIREISAALNSGRVLDAEQFARTYLQSAPKDETGLTLLALSLQLQDRSLEAVETYRTLTQLFPHSFAHWSNLGTALRAAELSQEAERAYRHALLLSPNDYGVLLNLGLMHFHDGTFRQARNYLLMACRVAPAAAEAHIYAAQSCYHLGETDEADHLLAGKAQWNLDDALSLELANVLAQLQHLDDAESILQRLLQTDPENLRANCV